MTPAVVSGFSRTTALRATGSSEAGHYGQHRGLGQHRSHADAAGRGDRRNLFPRLRRSSGCSDADPKLAERVVDNLAKFEGTESRSLLIGKGFGTTPSIEQGPDGNLYVVSITDSAVYMISRK